MSRCPACPRIKDDGHYLCGPCWHQLPAAARKSLYKRDTLAGVRLRELHAQIEADVPLSEIAVTA